MKKSSLRKLYQRHARGPSVAKAKVPQGAWALKPTVEVIKCADLETNLLRKADIIAELAELNLVSFKKRHKKKSPASAWADAGDIDDLETQIEDLETELADRWRQSSSANCT